jgi:protein translocase SecG subunit
MNTIITYSQIILAVLLTITILIQQKGSGLSSAIGGEGLEYSTKRGAEKFFFYSTIVLAIIFITISVIRIIY